MTLLLPLGIFSKDRSKIQRGNPLWIFTVTAYQGDGAQCTATKDKQTYISMYVTCVTKDQSGYVSAQYRLGKPVHATQAVPGELDFGGITCKFGMSQQSTPVMLGPLGPIPPNGLYYTCSTSITGGGQVPGPVGSVTWP